MDIKQPSGTTSTRIIALLIGSLASFALFAAYMVVPPAGLVSGLLAPFPAAVSFLRYGRTSAAIITLAATAGLAALFGIQAATLYLAQCGTIALVMPELLSRGYGGARSISWTTAASLTSFAMVILMVTLLSGKNLHQLALKEIDDSIANAVGMYEKAGIKGDDLDQVRQAMVEAGRLVAQIYPALLTVVLIVMSGFTLLFLKRVSARWNLGVTVGEFRDFRTPHHLVWLLIAAGFSMLAPAPVITVPALNILVLMAVIYFMQGVAVVATIIARQPFSGLLRIALTLMLLFQPYLCALVGAIGLFDLWGDFRTPRNKENL